MGVNLIIFLINLKTFIISMMINVVITIMYVIMPLIIEKKFGKHEQSMTLFNSKLASSHLYLFEEEKTTLKYPSSR